MCEIEDILRETVKGTGVSVAEIKGPLRLKHIVMVRHEAMCRAREAGHSTPKIGEVFNRDHTTVIAGVSEAKARRAREAALARNRKDV